jgi:hypothetical protein
LLALPSLDEMENEQKMKSYNLHERSLPNKLNVLKKFRMISVIICDGTHTIWVKTIRVFKSLTLKIKQLMGSLWTRAIFYYNNPMVTLSKLFLPLKKGSLRNWDLLKLLKLIIASDLITLSVIVLSGNHCVCVFLLKYKCFSFVLP